MAKNSGPGGNSSSKKAKAEHFITKFARYYTPIVVLCAVILAVVPPLFVGGWAGWVEKALIFLVVSCPCALVISVPLSFFGGIGGSVPSRNSGQRRQLSGSAGPDGIGGL